MTTTTPPANPCLDYGPVVGLRCELGPHDTRYVVHTGIDLDGDRWEWDDDPVEALA